MRVATTRCSLSDDGGFAPRSVVGANLFTVLLYGAFTDHVHSLAPTVLGQAY